MNLFRLSFYGALGILFFVLAAYFSLFQTKPFEEILERSRQKEDAFTIESLPGYVVLAFLSAEDDRFMRHYGIDLLEIEKAFHSWLNFGGRIRGASTITQQVVKNIYFSGERSFIRKLKEALGAIKIELFYEKSEILLVYMNIAEYGPNIYGLTEASHFYFSKPASELELGEAVFLVSLLPSPKSIDSKTSCAIIADGLRERWARTGLAVINVTKHQLVPPTLNGMEVLSVISTVSMKELREEVYEKDGASSEIMSDSLAKFKPSIRALPGSFSEKAKELGCMPEILKLLQ